MFFKKKRGPQIAIVDRGLENAIANWMRVGRNISKEFGKVLLNIGFSCEDGLIFHKYIPSTFTFRYDNVEKMDDYGSIALVHGHIDKENNKYVNPRIILSRNDSRMIYECVRCLDGKISTNVKLVGIDKDISSDILYRRRYFNDYADILVENGEYSIRLSVATSSIDHSVMFEFNNEYELVDYLNSLDFPVRIEEVYKRICEISLGEVSKYPDISLVVTKVDTDKCDDKITDMVHLKNGELEKFVITRDGKRISVDKNGNWSFEKDGVIINYDEEAQHLQYDLNLSSSGDKMNLSDSDILVPSVKRIVTDEIEGCKKRVRELLNSNKGSK